MTMPIAPGGRTPHARGLAFAAAAALGGVLVSGFAGWLGFFIFFAGYLTTWFVCLAYLNVAGPPTRKVLPSLLGLLAVTIVVAFLASEFGWFLKQAGQAGIGGNLIAYFWTIITDPQRWAAYLWWRAGLFVVFSAFGSVGLFRAMGQPDAAAATRRELGRHPRGQYQPPAGSAWGPPAGGTPTAQHIPGRTLAAGAGGQPAPSLGPQGYGAGGYGGTQPWSGQAAGAAPVAQPNPGRPVAGPPAGAGQRPVGGLTNVGSPGEPAPGSRVTPPNPQPAGGPNQAAARPPDQTGVTPPAGGYFDPSQGEGLGTPPAERPDFTMGEERGGRA